MTFHVSYQCSNDVAEPVIASRYQRLYTGAQRLRWPSARPAMYPPTPVHPTQRRPKYKRTPAHPIPRQLGWVGPGLYDTTVLRLSTQKCVRHSLRPTGKPWKRYWAVVSQKSRIPTLIQHLAYPSSTQCGFVHRRSPTIPGQPRPVR